MMGPTAAGRRKALEDQDNASMGPPMPTTARPTATTTASGPSTAVAAAATTTTTPAVPSGERVRRDQRAHNCIGAGQVAENAFVIPIAFGLVVRQNDDRVPGFFAAFFRHVVGGILHSTGDISAAIEVSWLSTNSSSRATMSRLLRKGRRTRVLRSKTMTPTRSPRPRTCNA